MAGKEAAPGSAARRAARSEEEAAGESGGESAAVGADAAVARGGAQRRRGREDAARAREAVDARARRLRGLLHSVPREVAVRLLEHLDASEVRSLEATAASLAHEWPFDEVWRQRFAELAPTTVASFALLRGARVRLAYGFEARRQNSWLGGRPGPVWGLDVAPGGDRFRVALEGDYNEGGGGRGGGLDAQQLQQRQEQRQEQQQQQREHRSTVMPCSFTSALARSAPAAPLTSLALSDTERDSAFSRNTIAVACSRTRGLFAVDLDAVRDNSLQQGGYASPSVGAEVVASTVLRGAAVAGCFGDAVIATGASDGVVRIWRHRQEGDAQPAGRSPGSSSSSSSSGAATSSASACTPNSGFAWPASSLSLFAELEPPKIDPASVHHVCGLWARNVIVAGDSLGRVSLWDLHHLSAGATFALYDVAGVPSRHPASARGGCLEPFADGQGGVWLERDDAIVRWDAREPRRAVRALFRIQPAAAAGTTVNALTEQRGGHGLLYAVSRHRAGAEPATQHAVILRDVRYPDAVLSEVGVGYQVGRLAMDRTRAFVASEHHTSISGGSSYAVWSPDLRRLALCLTTRPAFSHAGGHGAAPSSSAVACSDSLVLGASAQGGLVYGWDFAPPPPPALLPPVTSALASAMAAWRVTDERRADLVAATSVVASSSSSSSTVGTTTRGNLASAPEKSRAFSFSSCFRSLEAVPMPCLAGSVTEASVACAKQSLLPAASPLHPEVASHREQDGVLLLYDELQAATARPQLAAAGAGSPRREQDGVLLF